MKKIDDFKSSDLFLLQKILEKYGGKAISSAVHCTFLEQSSHCTNNFWIIIQLIKTWIWPIQAMTLDSDFIWSTVIYNGGMAKNNTIDQISFFFY
jgi:hypothetical protein